VILTWAGEVLACGFDAAVDSAVPVRVHLGPGVAALALSQGSDAHHALAVVRATS